MQSVDATIHTKPEIYDPFRGVRAGGPKEKRLYKVAMMGEFDDRKFPAPPALKRDDVKEYIVKKKKEIELQQNLGKPPKISKVRLPKNHGKFTISPEKMNSSTRSIDLEE